MQHETKILHETRNIRKMYNWRTEPGEAIFVILGSRHQGFRSPQELTRVNKEYNYRIQIQAHKQIELKRRLEYWCAATIKIIPGSFHMDFFPTPELCCRVWAYMVIHQMGFEIPKMGFEDKLREASMPFLFYTHHDIRTKNSEFWITDPHHRHHSNPLCRHHHRQNHHHHHPVHLILFIKANWS